MGIFCYCSTVLLPLFGDVNLFFLFLYIILNHFLFGEFWFALLWWVLWLFCDYHSAKLITLIGKKKHTAVDSLV